MTEERGLRSTLAYRYAKKLADAAVQYKYSLDDTVSPWLMSFAQNAEDSSNAFYHWTTPKLPC